MAQCDSGSWTLYVEGRCFVRPFRLINHNSFFYFSFFSSVLIAVRGVRTAPILVDHTRQRLMRGGWVCPLATLRLLLTLSFLLIAANAPGGGGRGANLGGLQSATADARLDPPAAGYVQCLPLSVFHFPLSEHAGLPSSERPVGKQPSIAAVKPASLFLTYSKLCCAGYVKRHSRRRCLSRLFAAS